MPSQVPGMEKLIEIHNGDEIKARIAFEENNLQIPDEALAMVKEDMKNNPFLVEDVPSTNSTLLSKNVAITKVKASLTSKLKTLTAITAKGGHKGLKKGKEEIEKVLETIDQVSAEETLIAFIQAADSMTLSAEKWLENFSDGTKIPTFDNIKRIEDYVASFSLLEKLREDMFEEDAHLEVFDTVKDIIGRHSKIRNGYLKMARKLIVDHTKGNFHKVTRLYERKAEAAFNRTKKPNLEKSEIPQAKAEYITNFMISMLQRLTY